MISITNPRICPYCGNKTFTASAHIVQEWEIDEYGNFICVTDDCLETTHTPDEDDIWTCARCGHEYTTEKVEPIHIKSLKEVQAEYATYTVFTIEEFASIVSGGGITDYDGFGYYHNGYSETDKCVELTGNWDIDAADILELKDKYPYVLWCNR